MLGASVRPLGAERVTESAVRYRHLIAGAAIAIGLALTLFALSRQAWVMSDGLGYQQAAERLASGEPLYVPSDDGVRAYRYAPWFAWAWMVLNIPDGVWLAAMAVCAVLAVLPAATSGALGLALAALVFPYLLIAAMGGHVQPAIIAALVYGLRTRWGPVAIALAASLKAFPLLFVLVYVGRRQWWRAGLTIALTAALIGPTLLFDLSHYASEPSGTWSVFEWSPMLWGALYLGLSAWVLARPSWAAASLLVALSIPRFIYYDVAYLLAGDRPARGP